MTKRYTHLPLPALCFLFLAFLTMHFSSPVSAQHQPLRLHPENPHYFLFRDQAALLITSAEHYGAVLNLDFDYLPYLDELQSHHLNLTRIFTGAYVEPPGAFNIAQNTLAPEPGRFICPWARSSTPGYAKGGNKFDLNRWDDAYFERLKDFIGEAGKRGIVVEVTLFCPFYEDMQWELSPMNSNNNVNNLGNVARTEVYTLDKHGGLLSVQEALVQKIVEELKAFDNLYYEICNEPYFGGVTLEWQHHIAELIVQAEEKLTRPHLISRNVANGTAKVENPHPAVSIFNFHYATPPYAVAHNYELNKVIGDNETGFKGNADATYRREAWEFILAGGGLFNHLDYSFTAEHENGTFQYPDTQPGGGSLAFRQQMQVLQAFMKEFDFIKMHPDTTVVQNISGDGKTIRALVESGKQYALYVHQTTPVNLALEMPAGNYQAAWINPVNGKVEKEEKLQHAGGVLTFSSPSIAVDMALRIRRTP